MNATVIMNVDVLKALTALVDPNFFNAAGILVDSKACTYTVTDGVYGVRVRDETMGWYTKIEDIILITPLEAKKAMLEMLPKAKTLFVMGTIVSREDSRGILDTLNLIMDTENLPDEGTPTRFNVSVLAKVLGALKKIMPTPKFYLNTEYHPMVMQEKPSLDVEITVCIMPYMK